MLLFSKKSQKITDDFQSKILFKTSENAQRNENRIKYVEFFFIMKIKSWILKKRLHSCLIFPKK